MKIELSFCAATTWGLIEGDSALMHIFDDLVVKGISEDITVRTIFFECVTGISDREEQYHALSKTFQFCPWKMKRFVKQDRLLHRVLIELQSNGHEEKHALEVVFNSYVIEDSIMREIYKTI